MALLLAVMPRKPHPAGAFGDRLRHLRKQHGWTQTQLAERIGSTKRAIVYYENDGKFPPAAVVVALAQALSVSMDDLMGSEPLPQSRSSGPDLLNDPDDRRLWRKFRTIRSLPARDQQAIWHMVSGLVSARQSAG